MKRACRTAIATSLAIVTLGCGTAPSNDASTVISDGHPLGIDGDGDGASADRGPPWRISTRGGTPAQIDPDLPRAVLERGSGGAFVVVGDGAAARSVARSDNALDANRVQYQDVLGVFVPLFVGEQCPMGNLRGDRVFSPELPPFYAVPKSDRPIVVSTVRTPVPCDWKESTDAVARFRPHGSPTKLDLFRYSANRLSDAMNARYRFSGGPSGEHHAPAMLDTFDFRRGDLLVIAPSVDALHELRSSEIFTPPPGIVEERTIATLTVSGSFERCSIFIKNGETRTERQTPPARPRLDPQGGAPVALPASEAAPLPRPGVITYFAERTSYAEAFGRYPVKPSTTDVVLVGSRENKTSAFCDQHLVPKVARSKADLPAALQAIGDQIDFSRHMVAWFGSVEGVGGRNDLVDHTASQAGLTLSLGSSTEDNCPQVSCRNDAFMSPTARANRPPPYTTTDNFSALSNVYLLPRRDAPLVVQLTVQHGRRPCPKPEPNPCKDAK